MELTGRPGSLASRSGRGLETRLPGDGTDSRQVLVAGLEPSCMYPSDLPRGRMTMSPAFMMTGSVSPFCSM